MTTLTKPTVLEVEALILTTRVDPYCPVGTTIGWSRELAANLIALPVADAAAVEAVINAVEWSGSGGHANYHWVHSVTRRLVAALNG